jgi:glycine cleavage system H protein
MPKRERSNPPTRRQFLKNIGLAFGGAALTSLPLVSACNSTGETKGETAQAQTSSQTALSPSSPSVSIKMLDVPGATVKVAPDRLYSLEHIWVRQTNDAEIRLGITDKIQALMEAVISISLPTAGASMVRGDAFGFIEGYKMNMDLICPVSGLVVSVNPAMAEVKETELGPINLDPYGKGWMLTVKLTKPEELNDLLEAEQYVMFTAGTAEVIH